MIILLWQGPGYYAPAVTGDFTGSVAYHRVCGGRCERCRAGEFCSGPDDVARGMGLGTPYMVDEPWPNPSSVGPSDDYTPFYYRQG
jgi:hypothetical protein